MKSWILALAIASLPVVPAAQNGVTPPVRINDVKPVYTPEAMRARISGIVRVSFTVLTDGTTSDFTIVKSLDAVYGLDQQAIEALKQWRFKPATKDGTPVVSRATADLSFVLRDRNEAQPDAPPAAPSTVSAPPSAWPASFADDISEPGATWKPDAVKLGDATLHFESPAGWMVRNYPQG